MTLFHTHVMFDAPGSPEVMKLVQGTAPSPKAGEVLIRVAAAGVNGPDLAQRKGLYPPPPGASPILGLEVSGEVVGVAPDVSWPKVGDKVCALVPGGGYAELVVTPAQHCLPIPLTMSLEEAAGLPETFFTVWGNLFMRGGLKAGETFLVQGGSGGIGSTAILLAKAFGARVLVTSGSAEKRDYCLNLGADMAFDYRDEALVDKVLAATDGRGVDVVLDMAGGPMVNNNLKMLADDGRMVSVAMQAGAKAEVDVFRIMSKRILWTGSTLRPQSIEAKAAIAQQLKEEVWPLLDSGQCRLPLFGIYPLNEVVKAHSIMEAKSHQGKLVLSLNGIA
ncbi:NAD(P)H-quinone oxidoreductase [Shewanella litorisediminis]|uniref:NAD(P)H-quinone oxidoreductase n=1 Tax=Shewanella litorisediminis TaxID=1173586 RepID=A0ABX7G4T4_9GAMM|nr:NAD(P)H-quinone oxidoreductase [Shewanella litorisediminis]MCL2917878.1 NAD(P)H-quinone oxidoreductase [Shewanella litorisediminis]QRH02314.1 NAD(P)H-quinone oxidoreductase [Shewanella litorisediminis]